MRPSTARPSATAVRRKLMAIARDHRLGLIEGSAEHELWTKLEHGWGGCGWTALFRNPASGTVVGLPDHCDRILCPYCETRRVGKVRERYRPSHDAALGERRLYLATLTVPNVAPGRLRAEIDRLRAAIARLRRRPWWAAEVVGGLWRLEVTINLDTRTWHPHANLLFQTRRPIRMADWQPLLQAEWRAVLGEEAEQWIWLLPGWSGALSEAVKRQLREARTDEDAGASERHAESSIDYTVKPDPHWIDPSDPAWVVEYVVALAGRRSVSSFGGWRGLPTPDAEPGEDVVEAPYAVGDHPLQIRHLPRLDPLFSEEAAWEYVGRGPRWALRPHRPPGQLRQEWLVWRRGDGPDPAVADDDTDLTYQAGLVLGALLGRVPQ